MYCIIFFVFVRKYRQLGHRNTRLRINIVISFENEVGQILQKFCPYHTCSKWFFKWRAMIDWVSDISRSELNAELLRIHEPTAGLKRASAFGCHPQIRQQPRQNFPICVQLALLPFFSVTTVPGNGGVFLSTLWALSILFRKTIQLHWIWTINLTRKTSPFRWISMLLSLLQAANCYSPSTTTYATARMRLFIKGK